MNKFNIERFYKEIFDLLKMGKEKEAREFLMNHLTDLPKDLQSEIMAALFEESIQTALENNSAIINLQNEILECLRILEETYVSLEDELKIREAKEKLKKLKENNQ